MFLVMRDTEKVFFLIKGREVEGKTKEKLFCLCLVLKLCSVMLFPKDVKISIDCSDFLQ